MTELIERLGRTALLGLAALRESRGRDFSDLGRVIARQRTNLRRALALAYREVPFYRDEMRRQGLAPHDFHEARDLARLPLLERKDLARGKLPLSPPHPTRPLVLQSSGTTGEPVPIAHDLPSLLDGAAYGLRERSVLWPLLGRRVPRRELLILAEPSSGEEMRAHCRRHLFALPGTRSQQVVRYLDIAPADAARLLDELRPDVLVTYGSFLGPLFRAARERGPGFHRPRAAAYYADAASPDTRALLDELGIPCFTRYKAIEAPHLGFECERHTGIHMNIDLYPFRVVDGDGRDVAPGTPGEIVVSNLVNRGTVILNYRLGDLVTALPEPCPCGRVLPLISFPQGRRDHLLVRADGSELHYQIIHKWFIHEALASYEVIQETLEHIRFRVVASPGVAIEAVMTRILERARRDLDPMVRIEVEVLESLPRAPHGKHRPVTCNVARPGARGPTPLT